MSRGGFKIQRAGDEVETAVDDTWLNRFAKELTIVDQSRARQKVQADSVVDQINAIMGNPARRTHATVESAVQEMQERTGLNEYLKQIKSSETARVKRAEQDGDIEVTEEDLKKKDHERPGIVNQFPEIDFFIRNLIQAKHGNISIPAVQQDILDVYRLKGVGQSDIDDPELMKYINTLIAEEQSEAPEMADHNVGKYDSGRSDDVARTEDSDVFSGLMPAKN